MTIEIELVRDGRVILQKYSDPLTMAELNSNVKRMHTEILDHATRPVHTITDWTRVTHLPSNILSGGADSVKKVHPMGGEIVVVTSNQFINTMARMFKRVVGKYKVTVVSTLDEAYVAIDKILAEEPIIEKIN